MSAGCTTCWCRCRPRPSRRKPDGTAYENTHADWRLLAEASRDARELGLVDAGDFVDRRAGEPIIYIPEDEDAEATIDVVAGEIDQHPESVLSFSYTPRHYAFPDAPGYDITPPEIAEPYAIEMGVEKSTMADVLEPIARRHGVTLITGVGELSLTRVHELVERVRRHGRKTRILYISDFDPAGNCMPVSIARKIEFILRRDGLHYLDIRLEPLLLTREQVDHYGLPRIPIKDSESRKTSFEDRFGEGAVELDALEALHPGELARLVTEQIEVYRASHGSGAGEHRERCLLLRAGRRGNPAKRARRARRHAARAARSIRRHAGRDPSAPGRARRDRCRICGTLQRADRRARRRHQRTGSVPSTSRRARSGPTSPAILRITHPIQTRWSGHRPKTPTSPASSSFRASAATSSRLASIRRTRASR